MFEPGQFLTNGQNTLVILATESTDTMAFDGTSVRKFRFSTLALPLIWAPATRTQARDLTDVVIKQRKAIIKEVNNSSFLSGTKATGIVTVGLFEENNEDFYEFPQWVGESEPTLDDIQRNMPALVYLMGTMLRQDSVLRVWAATEEMLTKARELFGPNVRRQPSGHELAFKVTLGNPLRTTEDILSIGSTLSVVHTNMSEKGRQRAPKRNRISINNRAFGYFLRNYGFSAGQNPSAEEVRARLSEDLETYFKMGLNGELPRALCIEFRKSGN